MLPAIVKLNHAFTHHTHQVCIDDSSQTTHFHQLDLDCDFYKFNLTTQFFFQNKFTVLVSIEENFRISDSQYEFVSNFQKLQTALRGPPQLI